MKRALHVFGMAAVSAAIIIGSVTAQEKKESSPPQGHEMSPPKPGPEHEILKKDLGVWDATVETTTEPGGKPIVTKGSETNSLLGNGLWTVQDFKGEFMGAPFHGHSVSGYDTAKKKYVGTWVDSMSTGLFTTEGTYDPKTQVMTTWMEGPCPEDGTLIKMRSISEWKGADTRVFTMYSPASRGEESVMMKITYKRRSPSGSRN
jgi:hypothetical protein